MKIPLAPNTSPLLLALGNSWYPNLPSITETITVPGHERKPGSGQQMAAVFPLFPVTLRHCGPSTSPPPLPPLPRSLELSKAYSRATFKFVFSTCCVMLKPLDEFLWLHFLIYKMGRDNIHHINCEAKTITDSTLLRIMTKTGFSGCEQCPRTSDPSQGGWWDGCTRHTRDPSLLLIDYVYVLLVFPVPACCLLVPAPLWLPVFLLSPDLAT